LEYDPNATPLNIFNSSPKSPNSPETSNIPSPHTPNYPPPILGGKQNRLISDISKLSTEQKHRLLESLKKKRDELNKESKNKIGSLTSIFDAADNISDNLNGGGENQEGGTRKITF
jgi:hypothetical protein